MEYTTTNTTRLHLPVVTDTVIVIVLTLMLMASWVGEVVDVRGAFLLGHWDEDRPVYMEVPEGMEGFYPPDILLLLLKTIYGTKQAAKAFWKELVGAMRRMLFKVNKADPCLYYKWNSEGRLGLWISWVDDCLNVGHPDDVKKSKELIFNEFDCDDVGPLTDYVGCKIDIDKEKGHAVMTQPVLIQSLVDEYGADPEKALNTPAAPGTVLNKDEEGTKLDYADQKYYRSLVGKMLHITKWTRPDIKNSVRELSRFMSGATKTHLKAAKRTMNFLVKTAEVGRILKPNKKWDGKDKNFLFDIWGITDSDFSKDPLTRKSVSGITTFMNGVNITNRSRMQTATSLSVTEAEAIAATECAQDMLFIMHVLESMELKVKKPMPLYCDNKGAIDLINGWSVAGRTRHISTKIHFLRDLKEQGVISIHYIPTDDNCADMFTKNLGGPAFEKHSAMFVGTLDDTMNALN